MSRSSERNLGARWKRKEQQNKGLDFKRSNFNLARDAKPVFRGDLVQLTHQESPTQQIDAGIGKLKSEFGPKQQKNEVVLRKLTRPILRAPFNTIGSTERGPDHEHRGMLAAFQNSYNRAMQEALDFYDANPGLVDQKIQKILKQKVEAAQNAYDNAKTFEELLDSIKYLFSVQGMKESGKLIAQDFQAVAEYLYNLRHMDRISFANAIRTLVVIGVMLPFMASTVACTVSVTPIDNDTNSTEVTDPDEEQVPPTEEPPVVAAPPAVTVEPVNPDDIEEPGSTPPNPEAVATPITREAVVTAIATSEFEITLTPEAAVESVSNDISIAYDGGFAYIATRNPNGPLEIKRVVAAKQASRNGDILAFEDSAGNITATINLATGTVEETPTAVPGPVPTEEGAEEPGDEGTPPPVEGESKPTLFTDEELDLAGKQNLLDVQWPIGENSGVYGWGELYVRHGENLEFVDFKLNDAVTVKIISNVHYLDASGIQRGNNEKIWIIFGAFAQIEGQDNPAALFGSRSRANVMPEHITPEILITAYQEAVTSGTAIEYRDQYDSTYGDLGDILELMILINENSQPGAIAAENVANPNGSADLVTYGGGITALWSQEDAYNFTQTGDPAYLPVFPPGSKLADGTDISGQHFIPALRAGISRHLTTE